MLACREAWAPPPGITGTWAADLPGNTLVAVTLRDDEGAITGTGFIAVLTVPGSTSLTVNGQRVDRDLTLHMTDQMGGGVTFVGEVRAKALMGVLHGLQFDSVRATFENR